MTENAYIYPRAPAAPRKHHNYIATMEFEVPADDYLDSTKVAPSVKPEKPIRKKFAAPPVKVACLEW